MSIRNAEPYPGVLIAFCGLDGSGKTTQSHAAERMMLPDHPVAVLRPVTTDFRRDPTISGYLDGTLPTDQMDDAVAEVALINATSRYRQLRTQILPRLRLGEIVLMDRYVYSTYAWALARGLTDIDWLSQLNRYLPEPDLTIYLDIRPETALDRVRGRGDQPRWEELDLDRVSRARAAFLEQPWGSRPHYHVLDAERPAGEVERQVADLVAGAVAAKFGRMPAGAAR